MLRLLVISLLLATAPAYAAPPDPTLARAKAIFDHAEAEYALAKYDAALAEYEQAFETRPLPGFLFNIGQCHRQLHHWERAGYFYRTYLEKLPAAKNRAVVESLIAEVEEQDRVQRAVVPEPVVVAPVTPPPAPPSPPIETRRPVYRRWYFWTAIGGVVVAGTAVALGVGLGGGNPTLSPGTLNSVDAR